MKPARHRALILLAWHLMVPPLAYRKTDKRFVTITDAPISQWYHVGEFKALGECHNARASKIIQEHQWRVDYGKDDSRGLGEAQLAQAERGRCLTDQELK